MLVSCLRRAGVTAPRIVHCDFAEGEIGAFRNNYPGAEIMGCDVHFRRFVQPEILLAVAVYLKISIYQESSFAPAAAWSGKIS